MKSTFNEHLLRKKIGISKTDFNDVRPSTTISWVLQLVNKMTIVFFFFYYNCNYKFMLMIA